jgi:SAM-dependent methyltransferase
VDGTGRGDADGPHALAAVSVTDEGLALRGQGDFPIDVTFDGRRIFSFWLQRDTRARGKEVVYPWPPVLRRFLDGTTEVALVDHVSGDPLHVETVRLGSRDGRIAVEDAQGNPMGLDKSLRLSRLFTSRSTEHLEPLLDAIGSVLGALEEAGVRPFLAYGTLLGAVRDGTFIGHDSDADLAYVSAHEHPVDAVMESFRLHRRLVAMGYEVVRHSGLAFKVIVRESDGSPRGLDVFGGLMREGTLYLMGEVGHPFSPEWLEPRSEVTLAGRGFPAPHAPEHLLEAMYGPGWRVPDPAYKFETPEAVRRRLTGWFRGTRVGLDARWERVARTGGKVPDQKPSAFVKWVLAREPRTRTAVDVGCGSGRDVLWLARRGVDAWGLDYLPRDFRAAYRRAARKGLSASFEWMNLDELRSVLVMGATLARRPGPRVVLARHVLEATDGVGRENLLRLAKMVTRDSGRLYLQMRGSDPESRRAGLPPLALDRLRAQVEGLGGRVLEEHDLDQHEQPVAGPSATPAPFSRWVVSWDR